jgi:predicted RNA-binding Zn ribbon-like protein
METLRSSKNPRKADWICLDFANTVDWHASDSPQDNLHTYKDLAVWALKAGLLKKPEARNLIREAEADPDKAARVLAQARVLREAVYRIFVALTKGKSPPGPDMAELNRTLSRISRGAGVQETPRGFAWKWNMDRVSLDLPLGAVALSAAELLVSPELKRVGQCADERGCGWLFLDTSRNHSRRWCDSKDCGNRERQRRHYERSRSRAAR